MVSNHTYTFPSHYTLTSNQGYVGHISDDHHTILTHVMESWGEDQCCEGGKHLAGTVQIVSEGASATASSDGVHACPCGIWDSLTYD